MTQATVSIIGLGWIGLPLAKRLTAMGMSVVGSVTTVSKQERLAHESFKVVQLQLMPEPIGDFSLLAQANTLVINIPPKASQNGEDFHPVQIEYLASSIQQTTIRHIIYVSSTSVYPELNRIMVEDDVKTVEQSTAPGLSRAEQLIQQLGPTRIITIVRMGGLMGYDRIPGKYVAGRTVDTGALPVNYLHRDDAVEILTQLINQATAGVFNAVAPEHPSREFVYRKSCKDFDYELPMFVEPQHRSAYKIVGSEKLRQQLSYVFKYPNPLLFFYEQ